MSVSLRNNDYLPTATIETLRHRASLVSRIRQVFDDAGFFEVETPLLSSDTVCDAWLEPFLVEWLPTPPKFINVREFRFLQTSPEFAMKRLMAAGADAIYQLGKAFRSAEFGHRHNPEFTMVEWYRRGDDLATLMDFTESLVKQVLLAGQKFHQPNRTTPTQSVVSECKAFERLSYSDAFLRETGCCVLTCPISDIHSISDRRGLTPPPGLSIDDRDGWLNFLLAELIEPTLGRDCPTFLTNYPSSQAAMAKLTPDGVTAERFELYIHGIELCNGYDELTDVEIFRARIQEQSHMRTAAGLRPLPLTSRLLSAMESGFPSCCGNALGVDRLIMIALGKSNLAEVISFPFDIA